MSLPSIYLATDRGLYLFKQGRAERMAEGNFGGLARSGASLITIRDQTSVEEFTPHGAGRTRVDEIEPEPTCVAATEDTILVGTKRAQLYRLEKETLRPIPSFNDHPDRDQWYTPWGGPPSVRSIAIEEPATIYVNVHVGGILRSRDGGDSWNQTIDIDSDVHQVVTGVHQGQAFAATARGFASYTPRNHQWRFSTDGLPHTYARAVTVGSRNIFLSVSTGAHGNRAAVYRTPRSDPGTFSKCEGSLPEWFSHNIDTGCLRAEGPVVFLGTQTGSLYGSTDDGMTWEQVADGLPSIRDLRFAQDEFTV